MGSIKKARYYHERALRGKSENDNSMVKKTAIEVIRANKIKPISETLGQNYHNGFNRIPSPSTFDRIPEANTQINLLPHFTEADLH